MRAQENAGPPAWCGQAPVGITTRRDILCGEGRSAAMIYAMADSAGAAGNPFAVLTAVVAPAILTNACSVLALGTSNRLARVVDPARVVARELAAIEPGGSDPPLKGHFPGDYDSWAAQLAGLQVRTQLLVK